LEGLDPYDPIQKSRLWQYKKIFFFERIPLEKDSVRSEDDKVASRIDRLLKESYRMLNYELILVPLMSVNDRVKFILSNVL
jgi:predicted ATPase